MLIERMFGFVENLVSVRPELGNPVGVAAVKIKRELDKFSDVFSISWIDFFNDHPGLRSGLTTLGLYLEG